MPTVVKVSMYPERQPPEQFLLYIIMEPVEKITTFQYCFGLLPSRTNWKRVVFFGCFKMLIVFWVK